MAILQRMALVAGIATTTMLSPVSAQDAGDAPEADTLASAPASLDFSDFKITQPIEEMQLMVKSSRILTLDGVIPKFQVFDGLRDFEVTEIQRRRGAGQRIRLRG
ncbi:MAG: hypothetical protein AAFP69_13485, partial [Planctomycetota bacterium]